MTPVGRPAKPGGDFGPRLFKARTAAGLRHADLARLVGRQVNTVARWERGERLPSDLEQEAILARIATTRLGAYYTPRRLLPKTVAPACGSGGYLARLLKTRPSGKKRSKRP